MHSSMKDVERKSHPSVPANYVSLIDLRERWMKKQQQHKKVEEAVQDDLPDNVELQPDQEEVKSEKPTGFSLPANYVSILDLRERWMKQQEQKKQVEEIEQSLLEKSEPQCDQEKVISEVEDKNDGEDNWREESYPDDKPVVQASNPNPITANRRPSYRKPWDGKEGYKRWVPLKQQSLSTQSSEPEPALATVDFADQSKPPLLEIAKVETVVQGPARVRDSEKVTAQKFNRAMGKANVRNQKRDLKEDLLESQPNKGVPLANRNLNEKGDAKVLEEPRALVAVDAHLLKPQPSEAVKVETAIQVNGEIKGSGEEDKDGKLNNGRRKYRKRHQNQVKSQPNSDVLPPKSDPNEKDDARVQLEPKVLPDLHLVQLKPSPLEANKVDLTVHPQIQTSDEVIADRNLDMIKKKKKKKPFYINQKRNQEVESVTQPHLKKENLAPNAVEEKESTQQQVVAETEVDTDIKLDTMMKEKKPFKKIRKRYQKVLKKDNVAPNAVEEKGTLEQEVGAHHNGEGDDERAGTGGKVAGLSVTRAPEPEKSCSRGSVVAGNWKEQRKVGSYQKFKQPIMIKTDRARGEGSLVWVKKGESSQTGNVAVVNSGNIRV